MGRFSKGPRLWLRKERRDKRGKLTHAAAWFILDGTRHVSTGCAADDIAGAENKLLAYKDGHSIPTKYVYFVTTEREGFPVKIGISESHHVRFHTLQTALPYRLKVLAIVPTEDGIFERRLHRKFSHLRLEGEWFERAPDLLEFIERINWRTSCRITLAAND